ncbi:unnamed protein product [Sphagnum troendelagicum]|uniref:HMA domain-containing protein n=1 Tax=Sphagnum troendelagicum TaxID=128251 RepID=A0ABP0TZ21_9BRYO
MAAFGGGACECGVAVIKKTTQLPLRFVTRTPSSPTALLRAESFFEQTPGKIQIACCPLQLGAGMIFAAGTFYGPFFARSSKQRLAVESKLRFSRATPAGPAIRGRGLFRAQEPSSGRACRCQGGLPIASITSLLPDGMGGSGRGCTGGGDGGGRGGGGGGGEDGFGFPSTTQPQQAGDQPDTESAPAASLPEDVIILEIGGMKCGGCVSSVKRILESQPQVAAASVNLTTETALVRVVSPTPDIVGWEKTKGQIAEVLAKHLTNCGFKSTVRGGEGWSKVNLAVLKTA